MSNFNRFRIFVRCRFSPASITRVGLWLLAATTISTFNVGCSGGSSSSQEISGETLGISFSKVSGDHQITTPDAAWAQPLVVRVTLGNKGVPSIPITFTTTGTTVPNIVNPSVVTDADGYARTSAVSPNVTNAQFTILAQTDDGKTLSFRLETRSYPDSPLLTLRDPVTNSTAYAQQTLVSVAITNVATAVKWCLSETQNTRPADGTYNCNGGAGPSNGWYLSKPTSMTLSSANGVKTVYIWAADQFNQTSLNPSNASIFLDTIAPGTPIITLSDPGTGSLTDTSSATPNLTVTNDGDANYWCVYTQLAATPVPSAPTRNSPCWVSTKPATVSMLALGINKVYIWTKDNATNISATYGEQFINYTTLSIANPAFTLRDQVTNSANYSRSSTVNLNITGDATAVKWCVSETQSTRPTNSTFPCVDGIGTVNGWSTSRPASMTLSGGDGLKTVYVWVANPLLTVNPDPISDTITVDTVAPAIPLADLTDPNTGLPNFTNQSNVHLSITGDTDAVKWCLYERASLASPPSLPAYNDACWVNPRPTSVALGATGSRRVYVYTKDIAENVSPAPGVGMITYTTAAPSSPVGVLRDTATNSTTYAKNQAVSMSISSPTGTLRWCVSETQTTPPATGTATCTGGAGPSSGWYTTSPTTFSLSAGDGLKTVYFWVADGANNVNATTSTTTITLDTAPPATPTVVIADPNSGSISSTNQIIPNLSVTGDTDASFWCRIVQSSAAAAPSTPALSDVCWVTTRPTTVVMDATGVRELYLFTRDAAGNIGTAGTTTIDYSTSVPTDPTISIADQTTSLTTYAKQGTVNLSIANDADAYLWCISEGQSTRPSLGTSTCTGGTGPSNGWFNAKPGTFALSAGDGLKRVYVWTANIYNTVNNNSSSASITRDQVAPGIPIVSLDDPNTGSTTDTNQSLIDITISNEDADVTAWCVIEQASAAAAPSAPAWNNACWTTSKPITQTLAATGSRKVYVYFRDRAYNISAAAGSATINYSTTAATTATLALSDPTTSSTSHVRQVVINATITGDAGAAKWCISESQTTRPSLGTSNCLGGTGGSNGWFTSRPTTLSLSTVDALKTVYLWTADAANNTSAVAATDTITLDTLPPSVPFAEVSDPLTTSTTVTNMTPINLSIQYDTDATNWCVVEQAFATAVPAQPAWNSGCWVGIRPTTVALGATGIRRIFVFTKDVAQNVSSAAGVTQINYTTTPPTDPALTLTNSTTGSTTITKGLVVTPSITSPAGTVKWCLSQTQTTRPSSGSATCNGGSGAANGWYISLPSSFLLSAGDGLKTVYLWIADNNNNVNANTTTGTITLDTAPPAMPTVAMSDPNTGSTSKTNQFTVNLSVTGDTDAVKWCPLMQAAAAAAPATPSMTDSCWRSTRPTTQLIDATGSRKLYVFTSDSAQNVGSAGLATIDYSISPPADATLSVAENTTGLTDYARSQSLAISITGDTNAVKWCVSETQSTRPALGTDSCNGGSGPVSGWYIVRPTTYSLSATDALKYIYVWTADQYNNVNSNPSFDSITLDTVAPAAPSVTLTDVNTGSSTDTNQSTVNINIGATADALAWCVMEQAAAAAAPVAPLYSHGCFVTTKPTAQTLGATGSRKVYVYTRDRAYNVAASAATATINYSTTAATTPSLSLSDPTTSSTSHARQTAISIAITGDTGATKWCVSETQTTRPALGTSTCTGGSGSSSGWHTTRPTTFTLSSSDASKTVYVWTADIANNTSSATSTDTITLDTVTPAIPTVALSDPNTSSTAFTNQSTVNIAVTNDTDATAWCVLEQSAAAAAPAAPLYSNACFVTSMPTTVALGATGSRRTYVFTRDVAQNVSLAAAIANISYSTTAPSDPALVLTNTVTGSRYYTNDRTVSVSINNPAGAVKWCISETQSTKPATGTTTCTGGSGPDSGWYSTMPATFQLSSGDALKTVYIWVADASNNTNDNQSSTTITLIENAPAAPTVALADPNTSSALYTNQGTVNLTVGNDGSAGAWCVLAQDAALAAPATPAVSSTCWVLTRPSSVILGATGNRKAYVFLRDAAMNISAPGSAAIALSTTSPTDPTLDIAHSVTALTTYAKSTALTVTIGSDASATRWCLSETQSVKPSLGTSNCAGGSGPSNGWYTVRPAAFTTSSGDGTKRVYVWIADNSNNVNDNTVSDTIVLDTTPPGAFSISGLIGNLDVIADGWLGTTLVPTVVWGAASNTTNYDVVIKNSAGTVTICTLQNTAGTSYNFSTCNLTDTVSYKAYVTAIDDALNQTTASNNGFSFTVKLSPPGAFTISGLTGSFDTTVDQWAGSALPTVTWTTSAGVNNYLTRILANDGVTEVCPQQTKSSVTLTHDFSTTGCTALADNTLYKAEVVARDVAGNTISAANSLFVFRTDLTAPTISITSNPAAQAITGAASFVFNPGDTISGVSTVECKLDAGAYGACDSTTTKSYAGLSDGAHLFTVRATDTVGLTQTASYSWDIDSVAPAAFTIAGATGATDSTVDAVLKNDTEITANWNASATASSYDVAILNNDNSSRCAPVTVGAATTSYTFTGCTIPTPGTYKIQVVARRGYGTTYAPTPMTISAIPDTASAVISVTSHTVVSGSSITVTLVGYQNGVQLSSNVLNPSFVITSGSSTGTFGTVNYIGAGTYTATFTGVIAGTAATISATTSYLGGFVSVTTDTVQVQVGSMSSTVSTVSVSKSTVYADNIDSATVTVGARDLNGNIITGAMLSPAFSGGVSTGTFTGFTETPASSGNYTATFKGVVAGSASNVQVTANAVLLSSQPSITVLPGDPTKIAVSPTSNTVNTHQCSGPYTLTLRDYHNNLAPAQSNVQINFGGLGLGNFSLNSDCSTSTSNTTIFLGGSTAPPIYIMPRAPSASQAVTFTDNAATLTTATLTLTINATLAWIGGTGSHNWATTTGYPARSTLDGLQEPRDVYVNESSNLVYVADSSNHRIVRYNATSGLMTGWIGRVDNVEGLNCPGYATPSTGAATPGWCTGGSAQASTGNNLDGMLNRPSEITGDGTYLYILDSGNHRIVRYTESNGEFAGWYGRVGTIAARVPTSCNSGVPAINAATPDWCFGGASQSSAGATNWDGMFNFSTNSTLRAYYDNTAASVLLIVLDYTNQRIARMRTDATNIVWEGWAGRILTNPPLTDGVNTAGCAGAAVGAGTPGWCKGGTSQSAASTTLPPPYTNFDNMFRNPRGLAIVSGTPSFAYFGDLTNGRIVKFNLTTGKTDSWTGRTVAEGAYQGAGGTNCTTYNTNTGWCTGGVPIYSGYCSPSCGALNTAGQNGLTTNLVKLATDGTYLYLSYINGGTIGVYRIAIATGINTTAGWVGRISTTPTGGAGCSTTPTGFVTPVWCSGGGPRSGQTDGHFNSPIGLYVDVTNDYMYTSDSGIHKIQRTALSTGTSAGWIGARASDTPTSWSTVFTGGLTGNVGLLNDDLNFAGGSTGGGLTVGPSGIFNDGTNLFVVDTSNTRVKRYVAATGVFQGWYGRTSSVPTGLDDTCTSITGGGLTPTWCYGGSSQGVNTAGTGELSGPRNLAADSNYVYIADTGQHRIVRISKSGASFAGWIGRNNTGGLGTLTGFDAPSSAICAAIGPTTFTGAWCAAGNHTTSSAGDGSMNSPRDIDVDTSSGYLFVADTGNHRINMYNTAGAFLGYLGRTVTATPPTGVGSTTGQLATTCTTLDSNKATPNWCTGSTAATQAGNLNTQNFSGFNAPRGLSYGNGYLYVADTSNNKIHKFASTTGIYYGWIGRTATTKPTTGGTGSGLGVAECNTSLVLNNQTPGWCINGGSQASGTGVFDNSFNAPEDVWVDPNNNFFYVADTGNHRVTKHNKTTGAFIGWRGAVGTTSPTGGDAGCSSLAQGTVTPGWCTGGSAQSSRQLGGFYTPIAITGDSNFVYVTDSQNNRVVAIPK